MVPMQVTAHALKCIDKAGGLDNYVLEHARGEDDEFERDRNGQNMQEMQELQGAQKQDATCA